MTEVIGVRFRSGLKEYDFDPQGLRVEPNQFVIVETAQGPEYAQCVTGNHEVDDADVVAPLRPVLRLATENDKNTYEYNKSREKDAFAVCQRKIAEHKLDMKLVRVESNFDGSKILFFFTSEGRVDFRELVRDLASAFRARIELRQIGVRDEAKMLGGIGICGRPFCCAQFLDDFIPVSIKMAKTQNLSLNPTKISGACGRLMCCLKYEQEAYEDAARRCPKQDSFVQTPDGLGNVSNVDLLREQVVVRLDEHPEEQKRYRNCEICVLRNGKGSREGIEIPETPPARYVEPKEDRGEETEEAFPALFPESAEDAPEDGGEKRPARSRRGGRRRGGRGRGGDKPSGEQAAGEKSAADRRTESRGGDAPRAEKKSEKSAEKKARPQKPKAEGGESAGASAAEGEKPRRRSHRGGRSHRRRSGGEGAPKAES